ncbi:family 16 glycosylhydrolase [Mycolicibacterium sp.]|uniref:family 16 glycosylhydrolase n=1 Tax=Mycolicibacterium sp. TaxID=2320850 RepID=UPI0028B1D94E|nr:family 16 glycosylhydrolase [Mycolicibacterium sp.]
MRGLAVALGIGAATAVGYAACASADTASSAADADTSTSQSVDAGPQRPSRAAAGPARGSSPAQADPPIFTAPPAATSRPSRADIGDPPDIFDELGAPEANRGLPDAAAVPSPAVAPTSAPQPSIAELPIAPYTLSLNAIGASAAVAVPAATALSAVVQPAPPLSAVAIPVPPPVAVVSPPIAADSLQKSFSTVLSALSDALSGTAPTAPADAAIAVAMEATRRERATGLRLLRSGSAAPVAAATTTSNKTATIEAERMTVAPATAGSVIYDRSASGGYALKLTAGGTATRTVTLPASTALTIRARTSSGASPNLTLTVDGVPVTTVVVRSTSWTNYTITGVIPAGSHVVALSSSTATSTGPLFIDRITTATGSIGDDFTGRAGSAPDKGIWTPKVGSGWDPGIETYSPSNAFLDGQGRLVLQATRSSTGAYTSGWVESKNNMSFGYGTITARMKVPKGQGIWPAFWLKGADEDTTAWPMSGEIDVVELPGTTTTLYSTLHGPIAGTTSTQQAQIISNLPDLSTDYHNYWVRHLPDEITFGVDDLTLGTMTPESLPPGATWVYNRPMQVILNVAVGGPWAGPPDSSTPATSPMLVDYVRWDPPA